jgi:hypothetical protein
MTGISAGHAPARDRVIFEMSLTALHLARDMKNGAMVRTAKIVIATLRRGHTPLESDVRALHRFSREAFR